MNKFQICLYAVPGLPLIKAGDQIGRLIYQSAGADGFGFNDGDVLVIAQKIVSKAENAIIKLSEIEPSREAKELATKTGRDPRLCQVYLNESAQILGTSGRMVITRHKLGFKDTSAGVDRSNIAPYSEELVSLLPRDPDASARIIRAQMQELTKKQLAVIICDTFGSAERLGAFGVAIGIAGIHHIEEKKSEDLFSNPKNDGCDLVDALASAAHILMGQANEGLPVVIVRGAQYTRDENASISRLLFEGGI